MSRKATPMPRTTAPPTADELRARADELDARAAELRAELHRQTQEAEQRRRAAERDFDQRLVDDYSRAALEAEVNQARQRLDETLAEDPLVLALADFWTALRRRSHGITEHVAALSRLGHATGTPNMPTTEISSVEDLLLRAAERIASERVGRETAELHARRNAAGDTAANNTTTTKENQ